MILQQSFQYADLLLNKHLFLLSMLKTDVLLKDFEETMIDLVSGLFDEQKDKREINIWNLL